MIKANSELKAWASSIGYIVEYESDKTLVLMYEEYFEMKKWRTLSQDKKAKITWNPKLREFIVYKKESQDFYKVNKLYEYGGKAQDDTDFAYDEYDVMRKIRSYYRRKQWMLENGKLKGETNDK